MNCRVLAGVVMLACPAFGQKTGYIPYEAIPSGHVAQVSPALVPHSGDHVALLSFIEQSYSPPLSGATLEWLDVDGDMDMDFISFTLGTPLALYENINQVFTLVPNSGIEATATACTVADINQDNRMDVVFIENRSIKIGFNNGNKTFTVQDTGVVLDWNGAPPLYCFDLDNDSDIDIITRPAANFYAFIPSKKYGVTSSVGYPTDFQNMSFADLDGQGTLDFFYLKGGSGYTVKSNGISNGTIYPVIGTTNFDIANYPTSLWADVDQDGDQDMFGLTRSGWKLYLNRFKQLGIPQLEVAQTITTFNGPAEVGDVNSDGKPDFIVHGGFNSTTTVYINASTPTSAVFTQDQSISGNSNFGNIYMIDLDLQSGVDIVSNSRVLMNTLATLSPPPPVPTGLQIVYSGGQLLLYWQSPNTGLTFRYEVYKDGEMFISSGATPEGSLLRYPKTPLVQSSPVYLTPLPEGNYAFRVLAVDASNRTSGFSELKETKIDVPVGLHETPSFEVYPVPAADQLHVNLPSPGRITIRDNSSRVVFQETYLEEIPGRVVSLPVLEWVPGIFTVQFESGDNVAIRKVVITR